MGLNLFEIIGICVLSFLIYVSGMSSGCKMLFKTDNKKVQKKYIDQWNKRQTP